MRWYAGWNILTVGLVFQAVTFGIAFFSFTLWVQPWMTSFEASRSEVMTVFLVTQVMMGVLAPFAGRAMDALQIRTLIIFGSVCFALALWLISKTTALWQVGVLYGTLFVLGTLLAGPLAAQTLAARWFNKRRGTAIGLSSIGTSLGGATIPVLVGWLLVHYDWRVAHEVLAAIVIVAVVPLVWFVVRNSPEAAGVEPEPAATKPVLPTSTQAWTTQSLLGSRSFLAIVMAVTPLVLVTGAIQQNFAPYASELAITPTDIAALVSIMAMVMVAGKVFFGMLADRYDHRMLYLLALSLVFITLCLLLLSPGYQLLMLTVALLGFGMGGFLPLLGAMVAERFGPVAFGQVMGLIGPFTTLAAVGPLLAGYIRDTTGSYDNAWMLLMLLLVPAAVAVMFVDAKGSGAAETANKPASG